MFWNKSQALTHRIAVLGLSLASIIIVVELPKYVALLPGFRGWALSCSFVFYAIMAGLPFLLRRIAPGVADFDTTWLPHTRSQWLWFPGMVLLLIATSQLVYWVQSFCKNWDIFALWLDVATTYEPATVVLRGVILLLLGPIAEEIFWRGYLLAQLGKLTHWGIAILIQALLFAFAHLPNAWLWLSALLYGTILGTWRIKFTSLLPLIVAHVILNGVVLIPYLSTQYGMAARAYPKCHEIDLLAGQPAEKAVPALIAFIADRDEAVSAHALEVLGRDYRGKAEPYLKEALASSDNRTVDRALFAVEYCGYSGLKPQVRAIAWSFEDRRIQLLATMALRGLGDEDGLRDIVDKHPNEKVRHAARDLLSQIQANVKATGAHTREK